MHEFAARSDINLGHTDHVNDVYRLNAFHYNHRIESVKRRYIKTRLFEVNDVIKYKFSQKVSGYISSKRYLLTSQFVSINFLKWVEDITHE